MHHETRPVCFPYQNYIYQPSCHKHQTMDIVISVLMMQDVLAMKSLILILTAIATELKKRKKISTDQFFDPEN